jgi:transcriptional regulator with XRE-family HTH domain
MKNQQPVQLFAQTTMADIAQRLRSLRKGRGWSLADVEKVSRGAIKAVVLGSYERSDRSLSVTRAIELANLYNVPLADLLCGSKGPKNCESKFTRVMIDLRRASSLAATTPAESERVRIFAIFIAWIASLRSDWNGEVMSLRRSDVATLALLTFTDEDSTLSWLINQQLLLTEPAQL